MKHIDVLFNFFSIVSGTKFKQTKKKKDLFFDHLKLIIGCLFLFYI